MIPINWGLFFINLSQGSVFLANILYLVVTVSVAKTRQIHMFPKGRGTYMFPMVRHVSASAGQWVTRCSLCISVVVLLGSIAHSGWDGTLSFSPSLWAQLKRPIWRLYVTYVCCDVFDCVLRKCHSLRSWPKQNKCFSLHGKLSSLRGLFCDA